VSGVVLSGVVVSGVVLSRVVLETIGAVSPVLQIGLCPLISG